MKGKYHTLAEAIREGCRVIPTQCFEAFYKKDGHDYFGREEFEGLPDAACVLGAAEIGGLPEINIEDSPRIGDYPCPVSTCTRYGIGCLVIHLNDNHRWTREDIANWLDTLE